MNLPTIAIIGGSGALGTGLTMRWLKAGYKLVVGTRNETKVALIKEQIIAQSQAHLEAVTFENLNVMGNVEAVERADIVVLCVPFSSQLDTLKQIKAALQNKILIDTTVPLYPPKVAVVQLPQQGSAAQLANAYLNQHEDDNIRVVSALQNVAAAQLQTMQTLDSDVLVCGHKQARAEVLKHIQALGVRALDAGPLANSAAQEALTSVLIHLNRQYKCHSSIRISGLES